MDDVSAITALIARYADCMDSGDLDGVGALFADGRIALADGTPLAEGAEAVAALYRATTRLHEDGTPRTAHLVSNLVIDVDDAAASAAARSRFCVVQQRAGALEPIITGVYRDRFARDPHGWHFVERRMVPHLLGDLSDHLLLDPALLATEPPAAEPPAAEPPPA
ncbi:MAG: nuclear transport factor 2 family protein [Acidimicrobiales bacterium]|nr:nuclear transport factor 2 family protein [Acidimicrobiales bacterium]